MRMAATVPDRDTMRTRHRWVPPAFLWGASCVFVAMATSLSAAPPAITNLYPAGAQRGTTVEVTATGTLDPWPTKFWVSGPGITAEPAKTKGKLAITTAAEAIPGVYWLRAHNADGASNLRPFIVGVIPEIAEVEPNDEVRKAQVVKLSAVTINGRLAKSGDVDSFAVALKKGETLVATLEANHTLKSPMDSIMQVVSADEFVVAENHDTHGLDPQIAFTAPRDGTFTVRVFAFPSMPDSSIRFSGSETYIYRLTLTTGPFATHTTPLAVGTGGSQRVKLEGWNLLAGDNEFVVKPVGSETFGTVFGPNLANSIRVPIEPHAVRSSSDKQPLLPPFSFSGQLAKPGDEVRFSFDAKKAQPLSIQVESRGLGLALNPLVRVLNAQKDVLARAEPGKLNSDTTVAFNPTADGTYTLVVSDLFGDGGERFAFLARVRPVMPDCELTVAGDLFTLVPGKPTNIPIKVVRKGGFKLPIEITAEGIPEGIRVETAKPAKPDPNTITLTLTAEKPASGPFQLVGKVKEQPGLTRVATAALPELDHATADLWVTATASPKK